MIFKKLKLMAVASVAATVLLSGMSCASRLPKDKKINRPEGGVLNVDLGLVNFLDIESGETINLKSYMEDNRLDSMLLTFGSRGCTACNKKGLVLRDSIVGQHPLYQTEEGKRFQVVGINTDPDPLVRVRQFVLAYQFQSFMKWNDSKGQAMIEYFMPAGRVFGVPLTVMITRQGIKWAITNDEGLSIEDIMAKVEETLKIGDGRPRPRPTPSPTPTTPPIVLPPLTELDMEAPGRLRSVKVTTCEGEEKDLSQVLSLRDYYVIQAEGVACGEACQSNRAQMAALKATCSSSDDGSGCGVISLTEGALDASACSGGLIAAGGKELFTSFYNHFSWDNAVFETYDPEWLMRLAPVSGPLTFIFGKDGKLVYSKEGRLEDSELAAAVGSSDFSKRARGPDFEFYSKSSGAFRLGDLRQKAKYTVVNAYGSSCSSCIEEMKFWSRPGELKEFCASRPEDCQIQLVVSDTPDGPQTFDRFLDEATDILTSYGIAALPLALDPTGLDSDDGYLQRFFSGYLQAEYFSALGIDKAGDPRSVIYDQEGRIVGMYIAEGVKEPDPNADPPILPHVDPVLARLKELLKAN